MRIVFIAPFAFAPKATVSARMLPIAAVLVAQGHQVTLLIPPYDAPTDSGKRLMSDGVLIENIPLRFLNHRFAPLRKLMGLEQLSLASRLAQRTMGLNPDVVHVFKPVGPGALAMWLLRRRGYETIVVDNDDWEGRGGWLDVNPYPRLYKWVLAWQERWSLMKAGAVTCASYVLRERTNLLTHNTVPTTVLPNGPADSLRHRVAQAEQHRSEIRAHLGWGDSPVIIYSGTIPLQHDMDIAVSAISSLLEQHPDLKWVVIATGAGLDDFRRLVQQAGIERAVDVHGFMAHDQLLEYLVAADIAVYPYRDTNINRAKCSGKVIDYMACARPLVISDVGMNRIYVENGVSGLLTPPGDVHAFAIALKQLLNNPGYASRMGRAAQARLWERFRWNSRVHELEALYHAISDQQT